MSAQRLFEELLALRDFRREKLATQRETQLSVTTPHVLDGRTVELQLTFDDRALDLALARRENELLSRLRTAESELQCTLAQIKLLRGRTEGD